MCGKTIERDILKEIVERRTEDMKNKGISFGFKLPEKRNRPVHSFLQSKGVILEVKRASPSKGDIAPQLNAGDTARSYAKAGAAAISCLTEENYFKGSLGDLMEVCKSVDEYEAESGLSGPAVLRKDFLINAEEVETAYFAGADAVLLIARILDDKTILSMAKKAASFNMTSLVEVRTDADIKKLSALVKSLTAEERKLIVCGVNSRDLRDFTIDLLKPCELLFEIRKIMGENARVVFESGIRTPQSAAFVGSLGFAGMLLGEAAAKQPEIREKLVENFVKSSETLNSKFWLNYSQRLKNKNHSFIKICGLTNPEDVIYADSLGADFVGFIFAAGFERNVCGDKHNRFEKIQPVLKNISAIKVAVITDPVSPEAEKAAELVEQGVLDCIQLHAIPYSKVPERLLKLPHYFAVTDKSLSAEKDIEELFSMGEPRFLMDSKAHNYGVVKKHLWAAGGITPENVKDIQEKFSPELVDVSGGVEILTGKKDSELMKKIITSLLNQEF